MEVHTVQDESSHPNNSNISRWIKVDEVQIRKKTERPILKLTTEKEVEEVIQTIEEDID